MLTDIPVCAVHDDRPGIICNVIEWTYMHNAGWYPLGYAVQSCCLECFTEWYEMDSCARQGIPPAEIVNRPKHIPIRILGTPQTPPPAGAPDE